MEEVKDPPLRLQLKNVPNEAIKSIIEPPHDLVEYITEFKISFNRIEIVVNNTIRQLGNFVTLFCDSENIIPLKWEDNVETKNIS